MERRRWSEFEELLRGDGYPEEDIRDIKRKWTEYRINEIRNLPGWEKAVRAVSQGMTQGLTNLIGGPVDLLAGGMRSVGIPVPDKAVGGSEWIQDLLYHPIQQDPPYVEPTAGGGYEVLKQTARGAAEAYGGAYGLARGLGQTLRSGQAVWETVGGGLGGASAGIAKERGFGPTGQLLAEVGGNLVPAGVVAGTRGAAALARKSGYMPKERRMEDIVNETMQLEWDRRMVTDAGGDLPETAIDQAARIKLATGVDLPAFTLFPELQKYAKQLSKYPEIWRDISLRQTTSAQQILDKIQAIAPEIGIDPAVIQRMTKRATSQPMQRLLAASDSLSQQVDGMVKNIRAEGTTVRSENLASTLEEMWIDAKLADRSFYENLPPEAKSAMVDIGPLEKAREEITKTTVTGKKWIPRAQVRQLDDLVELAGQLADDAAIKIDLPEGWSVYAGGKGQPPLRVPLEEVRDYRTDLLEAIRGLKRRVPEKGQMRRKLATLVQAIDDKDTGVLAKFARESDLKEEVLDSIREANANHHVFMDTWHKGVTGKLFRNQEGGAIWSERTKVLQHYLKNAEGAKALSGLFPNDPIVNDSVAVYFGDKILAGAETPSSSKIRQALDVGQTKQVLDQFPEVRARLNRVADLKERLERTQGASKVLQKKHDEAVTAVWLGDTPSLSVAQVMGMDDPSKRVQSLNQLRKMTKGSWNNVRSYVSDQYYQTITGIPKRARLENITGLSKTNIDAIRARIEKFDPDMRELMGETAWNETKAGLEATVEALDLLNTSWIGTPEVADLSREFGTVSRMLLATLGRFWGWQRGVVSLGYTLADRGITFGTKVWEGFGPEKARALLKDSLFNPEVANAMRWRPTAENIQRLRNVYNANILSQATQRFEQEGLRSLDVTESGVITDWGTF